MRDEQILQELLGLKDIPAEEFDDKMASILRRKNHSKIWWSNIPCKERDGDTLKDVNYRCCQKSNSKHMFCLVLERKQEGISVKEGFITNI